MDSCTVKLAPRLWDSSQQVEDALVDDQEIGASANTFQNARKKANALRTRAAMRSHP